MDEIIQPLQDTLQHYPQLELPTELALLLLLSWLGNFVIKRILIGGIFKLLRATPINEQHVVQKFNFVSRLSNVVPALIISTGIGYVSGVPEAAATVIVNVCNAFVVLTIALALSNLLDIVNSIYEQRPDAKIRPIKGYIQVLKIVIYAVTLILIIAALFDRSPLILLSGLGAMAAVLMLIFQDTILSLVASVQISSNDVLRVGDWVEMPQLNADGDVIDIALHTVKIQNWDKTITTIPTRRFMTDPFKNWRGMQESGGRRIKRCIFLDQQSVHFLDAEQKKRLGRFKLLKDYLASKQQEIDDWNTQLAEEGKEPVNTRRITNIGTFRAYVERYLQSHPGIHQHMTLMARQLPATADGLPLELYCFTNTTAWLKYESIQSDIFDHLLAILPEFGLRVYQHPSGMDVRALSDVIKGDTHAVAG
ncbi:mechanosensitive ion channel family protein [Rheinheimera nanhaiensis]|uniref:Mechanosensitive ion channel family protein n=1 Tax=Rheinheimera nanhaiensis E407-8 TaxID=562729 RepID=I1DSN9_9GAMM|nr:mechanosensitive ion channel family protein [Rheinheimera nanhaiensis]GAB57067.1 mechanosensitive ion channel family protein [Rheinheimera nanhaiensis E407-8]